MSEQTAKVDRTTDKYRRQCEAIWEDYAPHSVIEDFVECIRFDPKSTLLGFVNLTIGIKTACGHIAKFGVIGIKVKCLNRKFILDFPSQKSKTDGNYYPVCFPYTPWERDVITTMVMNTASVQEAAKHAEEQAKANEVAQDTATPVDAVHAEENLFGDELDLEPATEVPADLDLSEDTATAVASENPFEA